MCLPHLNETAGSLDGWLGVVKELHSAILAAGSEDGSSGVEVQTDDTLKKTHAHHREVKTRVREATLLLCIN